MSILNYTRNKNKGFILHEWDYDLKDNKINYVDDIDKINLEQKNRNVQKICLKANQNNQVLGNLTVVNYFFNNYAMNEDGLIINIDPNSRYYHKPKSPTKNGDLYYVNLERLYEYTHNNKTYYDYYVQKYPLAGLIACNFVFNANPPILKYIEFLDKNRLNHKANNLKWTDKKTKYSLKVL